jgi:hypothetical protein
VGTRRVFLKSSEDVLFWNKVPSGWCLEPEFMPFCVLFNETRTVIMHLG